VNFGHSFGLRFRSDCPTHTSLCFQGSPSCSLHDVSPCFLVPGPPERARAEIGGADQWVLKRRELPGFAIVNEKTRPHPWDTHHQFSTKTLLSNVNFDHRPVFDLFGCFTKPDITLVKVFLSRFTKLDVIETWGAGVETQETKIRGKFATVSRHPLRFCKTRFPKPVAPICANLYDRVCSAEVVRKHPLNFHWRTR